MLDGTLREFFTGATACDAMEEEIGCVIFDTHKLCAGECISPLGPNEELKPGEVYMLLPQAILNHRLDSDDIEKLAVKVEEALLMAAVEDKYERSSSFCGLREMLPCKDIGEKLIWKDQRERISKTEGKEKIINKNACGCKEMINKIGDEEKKKEARKQCKSRYVWYLGFANFPIEDEDS